MVFAFAGDSTTTSVVPLTRAATSPSPGAFLALLPSFVVFVFALPAAIVPSGRRSMPALPNGFESSAAQEVFPGPLYDHALELQLCELPQRFPGRDLRAQGEVVYMSRGPPVQQLPQFYARRIDHGPIRHDRLAWVGCRRTRFRCGGGNQDLGNWPAQVGQDVDRAGGHQSLAVPQQGIRPLGPPVRRVARDGIDLGAARSSLGGGDQRAR